MTKTYKKRYYVPPSLIDEINDIKREDDIFSQAEAMRKLVKYAQVGREAQRLIRLDWSRARPINKKKGNSKRLLRGLL
jgi:hypothetical protein